MEKVTVKVNYKDKFIMIGKGIQSEQRIIEELRKRFPKIQQNKQLLKVHYHNGANTLMEAYQIAQQNQKPSLKVSVVEEQNQYNSTTDMGTIEAKNDQQAMLSRENNNKAIELGYLASINDSESKENNIEPDTNQDEDSFDEYQAVQQESEQVSENKNEENSGLQKQNTMTVPQSEEKLLQVGEYFIPIQDEDSQSSEASIRSEQSLSSHESQSQSLLQVEQSQKVYLEESQPHMNKSSPQQEKQKHFFPFQNPKDETPLRFQITQNPHVTFNSQLKNYHQQNKPPVVTLGQVQSIAKLLRKQYDCKINELSRKFDILQTKFNDLNSNYSRNTKELQTQHTQTQQGQIQMSLTQTQGYEKVPQREDPFSEYKSFIRRLMLGNNIQEKSLGKTISVLDSYGVNEKNYKQAQVGRVVEIIRSI